ncbi:TPA: NapC/NirT family cytochrome c [Mannheimia haemolytica]|uniref:Cytochrome c-type protein n=3 Tax=Mannheimia haemolytica TaxID=75985 RepID=Q06PX1_MANHA|nr:NapC/NirT family cytochrome c [Mannheimia haemolytica]AWW72418.1 cytochrome C [Pasteurellaceae bacterium 12565]ABG89196.1 cytochrome C-type protein NapC [Mannheimia haemolytica]AGI33735.1 cytochrome C [Mannheimia haemolytica USDA-ARS-USMARC-183]AGI34352.1 cytochrome C [Mannheimia haemolytica USDA-ARS-USMARC-185]AGK01353.1 cytochrome c-type protein NapC [Mannheimia haemolytica M42548]
MLRRFCNWLRSPSKMAIGAVILISALGGIFAWSGFNAGLAMTNTEEFCSDCHMNDVVPEYRASAHYSNRSGVKAICSDCHVPHEFFPKWQRKIIAAKEVYAHFTGKVDTKEKFEAHRGEMAEREWARMKANSSQECRNCHNFDDMDFTQQKNIAQQMHALAQEQGKTCIDCHKGIAHNLPHMEAIQKNFIPDDLLKKAEEKK